MSLRPTLETRKAVPTMEGAGVKLHRAFGFQDPSELDPFLLFELRGLSRGQLRTALGKTPLGHALPGLTEDIV